MRTNSGVLLVIGAIAVSACAQQKTMTLAAASPELFDPRIPVEIVGVHTITGRHGYVVSGAAEGIGVGMLAGAGGAIEGGASTGDPYGFLLGAVLAPVFAVGGGVYGAAAAHPANETEQAIAAMEAIYADPDLLGSIDEKVASEFQAEHFTVLRRCDEAEAANGGDNVPPPDAAACAAHGAHSRLRLEESFAFATNGAYSPDLVFAINVDAVASDANPDTEAQEFRWVYISPEMDFFEATGSNAAALRRDIAAAQTRLARRIVEDLHSSRLETRITGAYWPDVKGVNFFPAQVTPGTVTRAPPKSKLVGVTANEVQ